MSALLSLVREDLREFAGYSSARRAGVTGSVWLNANESAWRNPADAGLGANRYPDPQPAALRERLGAVYGVRAEQVLVGRGSDEAIDLLVRALCEPGRDAVVILDNCEHVIDDCAAFAERFLSVSGRSGLLATSREALHVRGERLLARADGQRRQDRPPPHRARGRR